MHSSRPSIQRPPAAPASTCQAARPPPQAPRRAPGRAGPASGRPRRRGPRRPPRRTPARPGRARRAPRGRAGRTRRPSRAARPGGRVRRGPWPSLRQSPGEARWATSWNSTGGPPAPRRRVTVAIQDGAALQQPPADGQGQRQHRLSRADRDAHPVTRGARRRRPRRTRAPPAPPPTTAIRSGPAATSPATARAAASDTLRSSAGGSLAAEPSAAGISRGGCGQTAPAISMASVCRSFGRGGHAGWAWPAVRRLAVRGRACPASTAGPAPWQRLRHSGADQACPCAPATRHRPGSGAPPSGVPSAIR